MVYYRKNKYLVRFAVNNNYVVTKGFYKMNNKTKTKIRFLLYIYTKYYFNKKRLHNSTLIIVDKYYRIDQLL